ncbi:MAG: LacI family transcriptional regulator, partial [Candidatus Omnitrophica bacterium]|nr:LacI family transcriptional regulator [Candidatus Omnitrophota bacterium]
GKSFNIGITVQLKEDPNNMEFLIGFLREVEKAGYSLVIYTTTEPSGCLTEKELKMISRRMVDGFIMNECNTQDKKLMELLKERKIPFISYNGFYTKNSVTLDRAEGIKKVINYLIKLGHRRFVYLCHPYKGFHIKNKASKIYGFKKGIEENGLTFSVDMVIEGWGTLEDGYDKTLQILRKSGDLPTAFIYHNDLSAMGGMAALAENSIKIPEDVSVAGFDNIHISRYTNPPLTTVGQPREEIVKEVVKRILEKIDNPEEEFPVKIFIPELIIRRSTGPVKTKIYKGRKKRYV